MPEKADRDGLSVIIRPFDESPGDDWHEVTMERDAAEYKRTAEQMKEEALRPPG